MNVIWIVCPTSGKEVSTEIETDEESFESLPAFMLTLVCPARGETHDWSDMRGRLVETRPRYSN